MKITDIVRIDPDWPVEDRVERENQNFHAIARRVGLEFARTTVTIEHGKWDSNKVDTIPDIDNPGQTVQNTAKIPAYRVIVEAEFPAPRTKGVWYTDVIVGPHHEDTDAFAQQLQTITMCNVIFVKHSKLETFNNTADLEKAKLNLMFWAVAAKPMQDLVFDVALV